MPTYEYACESCEHRFDIFQRFADDALTACERCGGPLRKVFHPAGIVFKGSGFYKTDSRSGSKKGAAPSEKKKDGAAPSTTSTGAGSSNSTGSASSSESTSSGASKPAPKEKSA